jgi:penicillin amidase
MKRQVGFFLLLLLTGGWIYVTSWKYDGLNSIQGLANYREGLPGNTGLKSDSLILIKDAAAAAQVYIDTLGIPHIYGHNAGAVAFATGYIHARDRYFQMELLVNSVMGRLSEMIGESGIDNDRQWKKFELEEKARQFLDTLSLRQPDLFSYLQDYSRGVNAYLDREERQHRDPMYTIWDCSPKPWKPYYPLLIQWYMSYNLTFYDDYVDKQEILDKLPDTLRQILYPAHPESRIDIIPQITAPAPRWPSSNSLVKLFSGRQTNRYAATAHSRSLGSNNWVVGNTHTASGQLFLCNDLHLFLATPNIFYEMQLCCPEFHVYGYSIPGVPVILTGHNEKIGWGITSGEWDVTEQYLLKQAPKNPDLYWLDGQWEKMTHKTFTILVKDHAPETVSVKYTVFGPCVNKDSIAYGLMWHPQRSAAAIGSFWRLMRASDWSTFREALRTYDYPSQSFAYVDTRGNIGMICAGKMPVKPSGYDGGMLDGTISPHWKYLSFDSLPQSYNPARNYLFSANQQPEYGSPYYSSRWYEDLYRPARIDELLANGTQLTWEDMRRMQLDVTDISIRDLRSLFAKYSRGKTPAGHWTTLLQWGGELKPGKPEAVLYKFFRQAAWVAGNDLAKKIGVRKAPGFDQLIHFLKVHDSVRYGHEVLYGEHYFHEMIGMADSLYNAYMADERAKAYEPPYSFDIPSMTFLPGLSVNIKDQGGSDNTIDVNYGAHPVIRTLIRVKDSAIQSWMVNAIGQTGRINEKGYYQQLSSWKENKLHKTLFTADPRELGTIRSRILFTTANE